MKPTTEARTPASNNTRLTTSNALAMEVHEERRTFRTLDGVRGMAALLVVTRHIGPMGVSLPNTFLAVDLFFLLSGFVVAYAYDGRIVAGGFFSRFLAIRLIRLYPLYFLGILLGAIAHSFGSRGMSSPQLIEAVVVGLAMIPANPLLSVGSSQLNGPVWTLPLELLVNLVYAGAYRFLSPRILMLAILLSGIGVVLSAFVYGTLDAGWAFNQLPIAISRLFFSFFMGVILFRKFVARGANQQQSWRSWACVAALVLFVTIPITASVRLPYQVMLVLFVFPALLWISCQNEPASPLARMFRFLGVISYAVYAIHQPLSFLTVGTLNIFTVVDWPRYHREAAAVFIAVLIPFTWAIDELYDAPTRRWLTSNAFRRDRMSDTRRS